MRARLLHMIRGGKGDARNGLRPAWFAFALPLMLASPAGYCQPGADDSPLRKFEKGAQPPSNSQSGAQPAPQPAPQSSGQQGGSGASNKDDENWLGELLDVLFSPSGGSSDGAQNGSGGGNVQMHTFLDIPTERTMDRLDPRADITLRRDDGDVLIPYARYDFGYQEVSSSISGYDNRLEFGFGAASMQVEDYRLYDRKYGAALTIDRYLLQYRVSVNRRSELDFGVGQTELLGASYTALGTVSMAARVILADNLMLELRPTWARTVQDYDAAVALTLPYWSLKAGYRTMTSPGGTLQGPYVGFALHY